MASAKLTNISQFTGEDKVYTDTVYQSDGVTVQNLTSWLVSFVCHVYGDPTQVYFTLTIGSGITNGAPTTGVLTITVSNANTTNMLPGQYEWYALRNDAGNQAEISRGLFTLLAA